MPVEGRDRERHGLGPGSFVALAAAVGALALPAGMAIGENSARADLVRAQARIAALEEEVASAEGADGTLGDGVNETATTDVEMEDELVDGQSETNAPPVGEVVRQEVLRLVRGTGWDIDDWERTQTNEDFSLYGYDNDWELEVTYGSAISIVDALPTLDLCRRTTAYSGRKLLLEVGMQICFRTDEDVYVGMTVLELDEGDPAPPTVAFDVTVWK